MRKHIQEILPSCKVIKKFSTGEDKKTYLVSTKNKSKYVVKFDINFTVYKDLLSQLKVNTPEVHKTGKISGHTYSIIEYIPGQLLENKYSRGEFISKNLYYRFANTLRKYHTIKGYGFGKPKNDLNEGEYNDFKEYVENQFLKEVSYKKENLKEHILKIREYYEKNQEQIYFCHMDFSTNNIIEYKDKWYVIDPGHETGFNYNIFDLAKAIVNEIRSEDVDIVLKQILEGYYGESPIDISILNCFVYIVGMRKIRSFRRRNMFRRIEELKKSFSDIEFR